MELTAGEIWSRILESAKTALPEQAYRTWLAPTHAVAISNDLLVVATPNPFAVDWVEDKYAALLTSIGEHLFGRRFTLSVQFQGNGKAPAIMPVIAMLPSWQAYSKIVTRSASRRIGRPTVQSLTYVPGSCIVNW